MGITEGLAVGGTVVGARDGGVDGSLEGGNVAPDLVGVLDGASVGRKVAPGVVGDLVGSRVPGQIWYVFRPEPARLNGQFHHIQQSMLLSRYVMWVHHLSTTGLPSWTSYAPPAHSLMHLSSSQLPVSRCNCLHGSLPH